ncbi:hypothetical protein V7S43_005632 [Phytophthora oleae]|uniref:Uncharacterized protein n=1 Tax=Phytophthora oleae TaxID=2107226 RepID=A0ABD3FU29_9STRA
MKLSTLICCNPDYERNELVRVGGSYDRARQFCSLITDNMDGALFHSEYLSKTSVMGPLNYSLGRRAYMIHDHTLMQRKSGVNLPVMTQTFLLDEA